VYNPPEPTVLARAKMLIRAGQAFDTLHIVLAALQDPGSAGPAGEVFGNLDAHLREQWIAGIQSELALHGVPATFTDNTTDRLRQCEEIWRREALGRGGLTNTLVLATIVNSDRTIGDQMRVYGIDREWLLSNLQSRLNQPDGFNAGPPFGAGINPGPRGSFDNPAGVAGAFGAPTTTSGQQGLLGGLLSPVETSQGLIYKELHSVASNHFLNELGSAGQSRAVPIITGYDGSPLPILSQTLADSVAFHTAFTGQRAPLANYVAVYRLDMRRLFELAGGSGEQMAYRAFESAKQLAQSNRAILMLDHVEALKGTSQFETYLRAQVINHGETLVFGVFWVADETDPIVQAAAAFPGSPIIRANPFGAEETKDFLRQTYIPQWERDGFSFTQDAFDSVIAMESGAWINLHRKRLPFLVVDIATDTIETARGGELSIKATAQAAANALADLWRTEWPPANMVDDERRRLENMLHESDTEVRRLVERPTISQRNGKVVLTRAHVVAQLVCPNESEYHVPGRAPAGARRPQP
jgi:hypothetical protein